MNNTTKLKTGTKVKVAVSDKSDIGEIIKYNLIGTITNSFPIGFNNAIAGLYITDFCNCPEKFIGDIFNIYETDEITELEN